MQAVTEAALEAIERLAVEIIRGEYERFDRVSLLRVAYARARAAARKRRAATFVPRPAEETGDSQTAPAKCGFNV